MLFPLLRSIGASRSKHLIIPHHAMFKPLQTTISLDVGLRCNQPINDL